MAKKIKKVKALIIKDKKSVLPRKSETKVKPKHGVSEANLTTQKQLKNFKGKNNTNGFNKKKQNINKKGRPPLLVSAINKELESSGFERVTASQVANVYEVLLNLPKDKLAELANRPDIPVLYNKVIASLIGGKGFEVIEQMIDRAHGKSTQKVDAKIQANINANIPFSSWADLPKDDKKE